MHQGECKVLFTSCNLLFVCLYTPLSISYLKNTLCECAESAQYMLDPTFSCSSSSHISTSSHKSLRPFCLLQAIPVKIVKVTTLC